MSKKYMQKNKELMMRYQTALGEQALGSTERGYLTQRDIALAQQNVSRQDEGGMSVICTFFKNEGKISKKTWIYATNYGKSKSVETMIGYYYWAIPLIKFINKNNLLNKIVKKLVWITFSPIIEEIANKGGQCYRYYYRRSL